MHAPHRCVAQGPFELIDDAIGQGRSEVLVAVIPRRLLGKLPVGHHGVGSGIEEAFIVLGEGEVLDVRDAAERVHEPEDGRPQGWVGIHLRSQDRCASRQRRSRSD